jgi:hypothetical protein
VAGDLLGEPHAGGEAQLPGEVKANIGANAEIAEIRARGYCGPGLRAAAKL